MPVMDSNLKFLQQVVEAQRAVRESMQEILQLYSQLILLAALLILMFLYLTPASASDFDCGQSKTRGEMVICADRSLSDEERTHYLKYGGYPPEVSRRPEVTVRVKGESQLCQDIAGEFRKYRVRTWSDYCGVPIPENNPDYRLPRWESLDPSENLDIIKTIYYWNELDKSIGEELYARQMRDRSTLLPELVELYWSEAEAKFLEFIKAGRIELQHTRLDVDHDGELEDVYRMTPFSRLGGRYPNGTHRIKIKEFGCDDYGFQGPKKLYYYYVPYNQVNYVGRDRPSYGQREIFLWKGKVFRMFGESVFESNRRYPVRVCAIESVRKEGTL